MMFFTAEQETKFYDTNLWRAFIVSEKENVEKCCLSRLTQLSARTKKLTELDFQLFLDFNKKYSNNDDDTAMYLLCDEFIKLSRKFRHSPAFVHNIPTLVRQLFTNEVHVMTEEELEVIFYVAGWTIHALSKASLRRSKEISSTLKMFVSNVSLNSEDSDSKKNLPTNKVDRISHFGGLRYSLEEYFLLFK